MNSSFGKAVKELPHLCFSFTDFEHLAALEMPIAQDDLVLEANAMEPQQVTETLPQAP